MVARRSAIAKGFDAAVDINSLIFPRLPSPASGRDGGAGIAARQSATTTRVIGTGSRGRSPGPVGSAAMASTTSIPFVTRPKIV